MKKILSLVLSFILVFGIFVVPVSAEDKNVSDYPIVVVPGFSASYLFEKTENGEEGRMLWGSIEGLGIIDRVLGNIAKIGIGLGAAVFGQPQLFADTINNAIPEIVGDLACNPDGTPVVDTVTYPNAPAITNYRYLLDEMGSLHAAELEIMADVAETYGENGYENIFSFQTDFRLSIVDAIENLKQYIDDVLAYTGAQKVNIYAVSYGGQISASYLNVYGYENKVHNAVLTIPAIGGAALAYDIMNESLRLDEETLMYFIENGTMLEEDINWLMKAHALGFLDEVLNLIIKGGIKKIISNWGSIWDFIPAEYYEELKARYLNAEDNKELIRKSDYFHNEILPFMNERLTECLKSGTNVYIVAGCDAPAVTGLYEQSDGIILVNGATGAYCAPMGKRFSDGYQGLYTTCNDKSHNHISPAMNIDASTGFLPEQTWYISGLFHGMTWKDEYTKKLCTMLLFGKELTDVHTYSEFPQFYYSTNVCHSVKLEFVSAPYGRISSEDKLVRITNLSDKYTMNLLSLKCYGADVKISVPFGTYLKPGESIELNVTGNLPAVSNKTLDITVNYILFGDISFQGERTLTFTIDNGETAAYDENNPFTDARYETEFDKITVTFIKDILIKTGFFQLMKMLFNCFISFFN